MTREQRAEIAGLCSYITDDSTIACYVGQGVTKEQVRRVRSTLPDRNNINGTRYYKRKAVAYEGGTLEMRRLSEQQAANGSAKLLRAIARYHVSQGRSHWQRLAQLPAHGETV